MKYTLPIVISSILTILPCHAVEPSPIGNAVGHIKSDAKFDEFAKIVIAATLSGNADTLKKHTVVDNASSAWESTKFVLQLMTHMKVKSATFDYDQTKREFEKKGIKWNLSAPADGELSIIFKIIPQNGEVEDEFKVGYMVAKTKEGWRIVLPTTQK